MTDDIDNIMMKRCLHLAAQGSYHVKSNPMVGAVITFQDKIIGEGYHKSYGGPHAEIEALNNVKRHHRYLLPKSHMYVSLEPCFHYGKTPPCVDALIDAKIPVVTICNEDPNPLTKGQSIAKMKNSGITVKSGLLSEDGVALNKKFFVNQTTGLPYIILKWAQSKDGYIGKEKEQVWLSNKQSKLLVHRWREEIEGIMIGTNTAIVDDPQLNNRRGHGRSPQRIILDKEARIPPSAKVLSDDLTSIIYTTTPDYPRPSDQKEVRVLPSSEWSLHKIIKSLLQSGISTLLIEGGAALLKSCIKEGLWHEARVIHTSTTMGSGIKAPLISGSISKKHTLDRDKIFIINNLHTHPSSNLNLVKKPLRKH